MSRRLYVGWMVAKTIQILEKEKGVTYPKIMRYLISESSLEVTPRTIAEVKKALKNFLKRGFIVRNKLRPDRNAGDHQD
ncbi:uncharacterized protein LOC106662849 isoform X2 [Cimex lectularius]|uniref:H15 domain-containing protein n=1 Tax=Cimex lectularius TaxID=79782 RepID=A0A8I6TMN0_CIMLE|nr:uncharacterized protein LOC106662849 isoform X2 [Cimex lectularius]